jgi:HEAT repeat protein
MKTDFRIFAVCLIVASTDLSGSAQSSPTATDVDALVGRAATYVHGQSEQDLRALEDLTRQSIANRALRKSVEGGLIRLLGAESTFEARRFACKQLGIIGSTDALPAFGKLLGSDETVGIACLGLTTYPAGNADELLREALSRTRGTSRIQIVNTLGDRRDQKAVKVLTELVGETDAAAANAAISALGKIGDKDARKALARIRDMQKPEMKAALAEASLRCAEMASASGDLKGAVEDYESLLAADNATFTRRAALEGLLRLDKDGGEKRIMSVLKSSDDALKPSAAAAVRYVKSAGATERFVHYLSVAPPQQQVWLIDSLAEHNNAVARAAIGNCLASEDASVARAAMNALARMGDASSVPLLSRALGKAKEAEERRAIETALANMPGARATDEALVHELTSSKGLDRGCLLAALARRQGPGANPLLFEESAGSDFESAKAAFRALARTANPEDAPKLLSQLQSTQNSEVRAEAESAAARVIARIEEPKHRSELIREALKAAPTPNAKASVIGLLPVCGDAEALGAAKAACADTNLQVRESGLRALADWPDASVWDSLVAAYETPESDSFRNIALQGLARLAGEENAKPGPDWITHYQQLLAGAKSDNDFRLILGVMGGAGEPEALKLALPLLERPGVRKEAEVAVKRIAEKVKAKNPDAARAALKQISTGS